MRLIKLAFLYLLDRIKQNANSDGLRDVSVAANTTYIDPAARSHPDGNILNAFLIMDFHRSKMNEFLCHKYLITGHESDDENIIYSVNDAGRQESTKTKSIKGNQHHILISDVGSRQYRTWLMKIGRLSTRETRQSPQNYGYTRLSHKNASLTTSNKYKKKPNHKGYRKFMATKNRLQSYNGKPHFVPKNRFKNNWKKKTAFHKFWQPQFYRIYGRESASSDGPSSPSSSSSSSSSAVDKDESTPWFVSPEPPYFSNNVTVKMDYNFWDMDSSPSPPSPPSYGPGPGPSSGSYDDSPSFQPSPPVYGSDIVMHDDHYHSDDHPVIGYTLPDEKCDCDDENDDPDDCGGDGPLAKLMRNDMYHTVLIVFAFIGFTTFFMNMMSGLNTGNNSQMPSIMFLGDNNEENEEESRQLSRIKYETYLNNLTERSLRYIEQFQEVLASITD